MIARRERQLLEWLALRDPAQEPLYGDLLEELERRRSREWFWRQLAYAVAVSASRRTWTAKRAIAEDLALRLAMAGVLLFAGYVTCLLAAIVARALTIHMLS